MLPPQNPAGEPIAEVNLSTARRTELIAQIQELPTLLKVAVQGLTVPQLDTKYRNWTVRQIVHHLADSHVNAYVRFRLTLTEEQPTIKPYDESRWVELADARTGDVDVSLTLLASLHSRWVSLMRSMTVDQFARAYFHPEFNMIVSLDSALSSYARHGRHHLGQIEWLREQNSW
jgi:hypothetical protein